jgi:D-alanine-D-alanine ligase
MFSKPVLVEEYIGGREFNVPLIGNKDPERLAILEIDYSQHFENKPKILTYKAKWSKNSLDFKNTYSIIAELSKEDEEKIYSAAIAAYKAVLCTGYASVDLRMDESGNVFVIEVNSNCYIAPESDMLKAANYKGMSYDQLLNKIINYALERFSLEKNIEIIQEHN